MQQMERQQCMEGSGCPILGFSVVAVFSTKPFLQKSCTLNENDIALPVLTCHLNFAEGMGSKEGSDFKLEGWSPI